MVGKSYMLASKAAPSGLRLAIDQRVIPAAIDLAGAVEGVLERAVVRTRQQPATAVGAALATTVLLGMLTRRLLWPKVV